MGKSAIVLAAGHGTRMKSRTHKVLHRVCGKPMIMHILDTLNRVGLDQIIVVVGQQREAVTETIKGRVDIAVQEEQLGTGDAVRAALPHLRDDTDSVVVLYGDAPLIQPETLFRLFETQWHQEAAVAVLTAEVDNPAGFGRVFLDDKKQIVRVVEEKDATEAERANRLVNTGVYAYEVNALKSSIARLKADNAQKEFYLTDTLGILNSDNQKVVPVSVSNVDEIASVNDRVQLAHVEKLCRRNILEQWMRAGVSIEDPDNTYIESDVELEQDVTLLPGTMLLGTTKVKSFAEIGPNSRLVNTTVGENTVVQYTVALDSVIGNESQVGPFAYLRPWSQVRDNVKVGNFVEIKNSEIGDNTKVSHLAYVGDAQIGRNVNVGCGVITVNYDGEKKHRTVVGDDSFVGSNVNLIAPVTIGDSVYICAGSTVTDDVDDDGFVIGRTRQATKPNYVRAWKAQKAQGITRDPSLTT
ncbi:bifunctional UDP-N-acetylglucosamine diphosphorylase/glucosamine-1-phosphate N-acetyltransferase GlmU [Alicyclobacillus fodiniaquatilis]|uniref:Bifunctional protein GlmU n=1 Tax=Alicyclobacillus fodiniaquatilis TaxID=1661150 RepID=A0ABW4JH05_9BACL